MTPDPSVRAGQAEYGHYYVRLRTCALTAYIDYRVNHIYYLDIGFNPYRAELVLANIKMCSCEFSAISQL